MDTTTNTSAPHSLATEQALKRLEESRAKMRAVATTAPLPAPTWRGWAASLAERAVFGAPSADEVEARRAARDAEQATKAARRAARRHADALNDTATTDDADTATTDDALAVDISSQSTSSERRWTRRRVHASAAPLSPSDVLDAAVAAFDRGRVEPSSEGRWADWRGEVEASPLARTFLGAATRWWDAHPLRPLAEAALERAKVEGESTVLPLVRRHPIAAMLGGAAIGAALVIARPWRWALVAGTVNRYARPMPRRAVDWAMRELRSAPVQAAMATVLAGWLKMREDAKRAPEASGARADDAADGRRPSHADAAGPSPAARDREAMPTAV